MPNHVTTVLTIEDAGGMPLENIRQKFVNDKGQVDFDVVVPRPACLVDFEPHMGVVSRANAALGLLPSPENLDDGNITSITNRMELSNALRDVTTPVKSDDIQHIIRAIQNYAECGYLYWYDWCNENWGTKWNCYGQPEEGHPSDATSFQFETAWVHPSDLIKRISERNPGVTFHVAFADEDTGSNCGSYRIKSGATFDEDIAPRWDKMSDLEKRKFTEFSFRLCYGDDADPCEYGYGPDWVYSEDIAEAYEARQSAN